MTCSNRAAFGMPVRSTRKVGDRSAPFLGVWLAQHQQQVRGGGAGGEGEGVRCMFVSRRGDHGSDDALYRSMQPQLQQLQLLRSERMQLVGKVAGV
jgi:hypothetical protein